MIKYINNIKGITLIELLITMALMGLVLSVAYSFYSFGMKSFTGGTTQANAQMNARLVDDYLKKELRNVEEIEIFETSPREEMFDGHFKVKDNKLLFNDHPVTTDTIVDIKIKIETISAGTRTRSMLTYEVTSSDGDQEFKHTGQVMLNNTRMTFGNDYGDFRSIKVINENGIDVGLVICFNLVLL